MTSDEAIAWLEDRKQVQIQREATRAYQGLRPAW